MNNSAMVANMLSREVDMTLRDLDRTAALSRRDIHKLEHIVLGSHSLIKGDLRAMVNLQFQEVYLNHAARSLKILVLVLCDIEF